MLTLNFGPFGHLRKLSKDLGDPTGVSLDSSMRAMCQQESCTE